MQKQINLLSYFDAAATGSRMKWCPAFVISNAQFGPVVQQKRNQFIILIYTRLPNMKELCQRTKTKIRYKYVIQCAKRESWVVFAACIPLPIARNNSAVCQIIKAV